MPTFPRNALPSSTQWRNYVPA